MFQIIRSDERYQMDADWLSARWHFSFDHYYDPKNVTFGPLRVFNDDIIRPGGGFPMHPHREMEIITYVISGELEHRDSKGNRGVLRAGDLQHMSAGTGIRHSEGNPGAEPLHLCQIWVMPAVQGLDPSYEEIHYEPSERQGRLLPVVTPAGEPGTLKIHQDTTFYVSRLSPGEKVTHPLQPGRRVYLFVIEGDVQVNGHRLSGGDQARVTAENRLEILADATTELILLDLP